MNPFGKLIEEVQEADLMRLVEDRVSEGPDIDYKRGLPDFAQDRAKQDFLDDVSAFANSSGGCLVYGVVEAGGSPVEIKGVGDDDLDRTQLRIEDILRAHLRPRLSPAPIFKAVQTTKGRVFIVYVRKSWRAPHMVGFPADRPRFVLRGSAGNRVMDVDDLRSAFLGSSSIERTVGEFRASRVAKQAPGGEMPFLLPRGPALLVHVVPLSSVGNSQAFSAIDLSRFGMEVRSGGFMDSHRFNLDGYAYAAGGEPGNRRGYAQFFRNGAIEFVSKSPLTTEPGDPRGPCLYIYHVEQNCIRWLSVALNVQKALGIEPPIAVLISLLGVRGLRFALDERAHFYSDTAERFIERNDLLLDPILLEEYDGEADRTLEGALNSIWQAAGWERSWNFNDGRWSPRR